MGLRPRARVELRYNNYGGVFEQLARYTIKYQESNLPLGLYSPLTSANNRILNLYSSSLFNPYSPLPLLISQIAMAFIGAAGHVWVGIKTR